MNEYSSAKTGEYPSDILQFSKLRVLRKIFEGLLTHLIASIWREDMLAYLSLDIIRSEKRTFSASVTQGKL